MSRLMLPSFVDQEFLRHLFMAAPDALLLCDETGTILLANDQTFETFGYRREELTGKPVELLVPRRYRAEHPGQRARYLTNPVVRPMGSRRSLHALHKSGSEIPVDISLSTLTTPGGRYVLASLRNMSEQRAMETFIHDGNLILSRLAAGGALKEILPMIVTFVERGGSCVRCCILRHDSARNRWRVEAAPSLAPEMRVAWEGLAPESGGGLWTQAAFHGEPMIITDVGTLPYQTEFSALAPPGTRACWSEPIIDSQGGLLGTFVALCDAPRAPSPRESDMLSLAAHMAGIGMERDRRTRQLVEQEQRLRQKHKLEAIGSLTGGIAHEFNNLLQTITAYTDFALAGASQQASLRDDLQTVRKAADRATALTGQLLSFCRRHPMERRVIGLNDLVADTCTLLRPLLGETIELRTKAAKEQPKVVGDFGQLQQALINLCLNARDAMPDGGTLEIATSAASEPCRAECLARPDAAVIAVRDTGSGMTPEVKDRMFEPFFTTKEQGKGTGLGLPAVYGIVQQHEGEIEVHTARGEGTVVRILLPPTTGKPARPEEPIASQGASTPGGGAVLLVAEDDEAVRGALERILTDAGYLVLVAEDGDVAARYFEHESRRIDLVLLDMIMPKCGGRCAAERIRAVRPDVPIVFCSGYDPDENDTSENHAEPPILMKPIEARRLLEVVRNVLQATERAGRKQFDVR